MIKIMDNHVYYSLLYKQLTDMTAMSFRNFVFCESQLSFSFQFGDLVLHGIPCVQAAAFYLLGVPSTAKSTETMRPERIFQSLK